MRHTVEHLGPQHKSVDLMVDEGFAFRVCPEFEIRRFTFMKDFIAQHGRIFFGSPFDSQYEKKPIGGRCYDQAAELACAAPLLTYCEGIMIAKLSSGIMFPMPHAWCCKSDGSVVDPTAHKYQDHPSVKYMGVPFKLPYVMWWKAVYGFHGLLDGHPDFGDQIGVYVDPPSAWKAVLR